MKSGSASMGTDHDLLPRWCRWARLRSSAPTGLVVGGNADSDLTTEYWKHDGRVRPAHPRREEGTWESGVEWSGVRWSEVVE